MKIVRQKTGVACIALPDDELIFVDPDLSDPKDLVHAIHEALPEVHLDAIGHWVEGVMPTAAPLANALQRRPTAKPKGKRRPGHRAATRASRAGLQLGSMATAAAAAAALTVVGVSVVPGVNDTPAAAAEAWQNEVFARIQTGSSWDCRGTDSSDLVATCVTPDGTVMQAEAWVGPNSLTFVFTYRDAQTGVQHRDTLKVFSSQGGVKAFLNNAPTDKRLLPNMVAGERWVMYGSDQERIQRWSERLSKDMVLPADVSEVAFEMGLLPSPEPTESNAREMAHVPEIVRTTAARILVGDRTLPIPSSTPALPDAPAGGVDFPPPGPVATHPAPVPAQPSPSAPTPAPTPTPVPPPPEPVPVPVPMPDPTTPPPVSDPVTEPVPDPPASDPSTQPVPDPPADPPASDPSTQPVPDPPAEPPAVDPDPVGGDLPSCPDQAPTEVVEPEQGPAQPADPLTDPIEIPADERAPLHEEGVQFPIFASVAADMAAEHGSDHQHGKDRQHGKGHERGKGHEHGKGHQHGKGGPFAA